MTNPNQTNPNQSPNPNRLTQDPKLFSAHLKSASPPTNPIRTWLAPYRALIDYHLSKTLTAPRLSIQPPRRENTQTWLTRVLSSHLGNHQPLRTSNLINQLINLELDLCRAAEGLPWLKPILSDIANLTDQPAARVNSAPRRALQTQFLASIDPAAKRPEPLVIIDDPATLPRQPRTKSTPNRTQPRNLNNHTGLRDLYRDFPQLLDH